MYNYNPYFNGPMMQPQASMPIQSIQQVQKSAQFYTVENAQELDGIKPTLNVLYVGFNKKAKEIYVKQLTNDGLISVETYGLATDKKQKSEYETILERINDLENKLTKGATNVSDNATNGTIGPANVNVGQAQ
jgi:hypothetical protein